MCLATGECVWSSLVSEARHNCSFKNKPKLQFLLQKQSTTCVCDIQLLLLTVSFLSLADLFCTSLWLVCCLFKSRPAGRAARPHDSSGSALLRAHSPINSCLLFRPLRKFTLNSSKGDCNFIFFYLWIFTRRNRTTWSVFFFFFFSRRLLLNIWIWSQSLLAERETLECLEYLDGRSAFSFGDLSVFGQRRVARRLCIL